MIREIPASIFCLVALVVAGCGGGASTVDMGADNDGQRSEGFEVASGAKPLSLDPLVTESDDGLEVARQMFEPLEEVVMAPRSQKRVKGLVLSWQRSRSRRVWLASLRSRVSFQDGAKLDARAVVVNARRWSTTEIGRALLGSTLRKVTASSRSMVRFSFVEPVSDLPKRLSSPRLAVVSPRALRPSSGREATLNRVSRSGSGPFRLESRRSGTTVLKRSNSWWARRAGIVPELETIVFRWEPDERKRADLLKSGETELATGIDHIGVDAVAGDPNVQILGDEGGRRVAALRWVRGLFVSENGFESLAGVWLSRAGTGR